MIPFALYLIVFSGPLVSVLAAGGFTPEALEMTSSYLAVYALSLPFYAACMYLQKVASSMRRMGLYAWSNALATVLQIWILLAYTTIFGLNFVAFSSLLFFALIDTTLFVFGIRSEKSSSFYRLLFGKFIVAFVFSNRIVFDFLWFVVLSF